MKTMKQFLLITFLFISVLGKAQTTFLPDEIWFDTGKNIYIQFMLPTIYQLDQYSDAGRTFAQFYKKNLQDQLLKYNENQKISIKLDEKNNENLIQLSKESIQLAFSPPVFKDNDLTNLQELKLITGDGIKINCYFQNLNELKLYLQNDWENNINLLVSEVQKLPSANKRKAVSLFFRNTGGKIGPISSEFNKEVKNLDMMMLTGGIGVNLFKGMLLPSFEGRLGLAFNRKGILRNCYFLNTEVISDFVNENGKLTPKFGHFLDIGYMRNFSNIQDRADWYGFSVGYLLNKNSDTFDDHTWRLSIHRAISKNIELVPMMYFPENFSEIFPALKLKIDF
jgi:hypothetical protein